MDSRNRLTILIVALVLIANSIILFMLYQAKKPRQTRPYADNRVVSQVAGIKESNKVDAIVTKTDNLDILWFGDLMLDRYVSSLVQKNGLESLLGNLNKQVLFTDYDLIGANLETAVTKNGAHYDPKSENDFAVSPEILSQLKQYNFNFFNIANNHITDQGVKGDKETRDHLSLLGFNWSGAPDGLVDERSFYLKEIKGRKIALHGYSMVYRDFDLEKAKQQIMTSKEMADLIIVNIHWGKEYQTQFNRQQQSVAYALIESGADLIIGHHPHVFQGMEIYQNKPIFYSLGNFIFDQYWSQETQRGLAISLKLDADKTTIKLFPMKSVKSQPVILSGLERDVFLADFVKRSKINEVFKKQIATAQLEIN